MNDSVVIIGDNGDPRLCVNNCFGRKIKESTTANNMHIVGFEELKEDIEVATWQSDDCLRQSWIDFALISENIEVLVKNFEIVNDSVPTSDHWPICLQLKLNLLKEPMRAVKQNSRYVTQTGFCVRKTTWNHIDQFSMESW